jgi:hypothetical protein
MSSNTETLYGTAATSDSSLSARKHSYSRRRWSAFDAWQEHVRKSAATVGVAFADRHDRHDRHDRDLRRAIVTG